MLLLMMLVCSISITGGRTSLPEIQGPVFTKEPPTRIDFSNSTGTKILCSVRGNPSPKIQWIRRDGTEVNEVAALRVLKPDGSMHLLPFRAEEYRQDIHAVVYRCVASNSVGVVISKEVNVRGVVKQYYEVQVYDEYVIRGNTAALRCHIPSFVRDYVKVTSWSIDDVLLPPSTSNQHYTITNSGELYIRQVEPSDGAKSYKCKTIHRLTNETQISAPSRVIVTDPQSSVPPRITHTVPNYICKQGETAYIPCVAQGYPVPSYRWFRGQNKQMDVVVPNNRITQFNGILMIQRSHISDSGVYACVVNNSVGEERVEINLLVTAPLQAEVQPRQQVIDAGKSAVFNCVVSGHPLVSVSWFKDGEPVATNNRIRLTTKNTLQVSDVQRADVGMYQCFVENEDESVQATAELKLGDAAPLFHYTFADETHHEGPPVSLKCVASGNPPPTITWTLDDAPVTDVRRFSVGNQVSLTGEVVSYVNISRLRVEDGGEYSCVANNKVGRIEHTAKLNVHGLPYVRLLPNITVVAGQSLSVRCRATGFPIENILWERDEKQLPANLRQKVYSNGTLEIHRVERPADEGRYTCIASNTQGQTARRNLWVTIMAPPIIDKFSFPPDLREGMRTRISCVVSDGDLPISISWRKDSRPIPKHAGLEIHSGDEFSSSVTFRSVTSVHNGNYTCVASNSAATVNYSAELLVHVPPHWVREPEDFEVLNGETAILHCQADGFPKPKTIWLKARSDTPGDYAAVISGREVSSIVDNGSLIIDKASKQHQGFYLCQAANGIGSGLSKVVALKVKVSAYFETKYTNYTAERQTEAVLRCNAKGDNPVEIMWVRSKERINFRAETRMSLKEYKAEDGLVSELIIKKVEPSDAAVYGCVASNPFGHDEAWIEVIVQELPGPPTNVKVIEVSSKFVQLSWTPGKTGNSVIDKYVVRYRRQSSGWTGPSLNASVESSDTSVVIHQLTPGATYKLWVTSVNNIGESPVSETVEVTCAEEIPGGAPLAVEAKAVGADSIKVTWKPPKKELWNGEILGYYIGYKIYDNPEPYDHKILRVSPDFKEEIYLTNLQKFTKYSVVVQAFNRMGSGPDSDEVIAYTLEDVPSEPPQNVQCTTTSSQGVEVMWSSPPPASQNGIIRGFKIVYRMIDRDDGEEDVKVEVLQATASRAQLHTLTKYTNYSIQVLAFTRVGEGAASNPVFCRTDEDVPGAPAGIKALVMSSDAIIVTWKPPVNPNGIIIKYTLYMRVAETGDHHVGKHILSSVPHLSFIAQGLKENLRYEFWVTASTVMGEGESTKVDSQSPKTRVPAKISSFSDSVVVPHKETAKLPCRVVGIPTPSREWKIGGKIIQDDDKIRVGQDGALIIQNLQNPDTGNYSCHVVNAYGKDEITYYVSVKAPPVAPVMTIAKSTRSSITISWKPGDDGGSRILGFSLSFKRDFGEWEEIEIKPEKDTYTLNNLNCGSRYQLYLTAFNKMGSGQPSGIITANTEGSAPLVANREEIIEPNSTFILIRLDKWPDGGCRVLYFVIQYKPKNQKQWTLVSNNIQSAQAEFIITDLHHGSLYNVQITAHNDAGSTVAEYEFRTLPAIGGSLYDQTIQLNDRNEQEPGYVDLSIIVPVTASVASVIIALVAVCLFTRRRKYRGYQHSQNGISYTSNANKPNVDEKQRPNNVQQNHACNAQLSYSPLPTKKNEETSVANTDTKSTKSTKSTNSKNYQEDVAPYATFSLPSLHDENDVNSLQMKTFYEKEIGINNDTATGGVEETYAKTKKRQSPPKTIQENGESTASVILSPSHFSKAENPYQAPGQYQRRSKDYSTLPAYQRNPAADYERIANAVQSRNKLYEFYPKAAPPVVTQDGKPKDSSTSNESSPDEERNLHRRSRGRYGQVPRLPFLAHELIGTERWSPSLDISSSSLSLRPPIAFSDSQEFSAAECDRDIILQYRKDHRKFRSRSSARIDDDGDDEEEDDDDVGVKMPFRGKDVRKSAHECELATE